MSTIRAIRRPGPKFLPKRLSRAVAHARTRRNISRILRGLNLYERDFTLAVSQNVQPLYRKLVREREDFLKKQSRNLGNTQLALDYFSRLKNEVVPQFHAVSRRMAVVYAAREIGLKRSARAELVKFAVDGNLVEFTGYARKHLNALKSAAFLKAYRRYNRAIDDIVWSKISHIVD